MATPFKSCLDDPKSIGDIYRERLGGAPFPITRDPPRKPRWYCLNTGCSYWVDEENGNHGTCVGACHY